MARPYIEAVKETLPHVDVVFDRFHIMKIVNTAVDEVRKNLGKRLHQNNRRAFKRSRFLILRNESTLLPSERARLEEVLAYHEPLMIAHMMKEELRRLWTMPSRKAANEFLIEWCLDIASIEIEYDRLYWEKAILEPLKKLSFFLLRHREGILAYFDHFITNGMAEGLNNKIKTLKRQAYGYRDLEYFKLRLYHLHRQKNQLTG